MGDVQKVPLFHPDGSVQGQVQVVYNNLPNLLIGAQNLAVLRCQELFEYAQRIVQVMEIKNLEEVLGMLTQAEQENRSVYVIFWKGSRSGLQMCTKTETQLGIINGESTPMVALFASMNLYNRDYPVEPADAVKEFVKQFIS